MNNKANFWRAATTLGVWIFAVGALALISIEMAPVVGDDVLGAVFMILVAVVVSTGFIWDWGQTGEKRSSKDRKAIQRLLDEHQTDNYGSKRKRDRLAVALSQLSDGELVDLRSRLQRGELSEEDLEYALNDDDRY